MSTTASNYILNINENYPIPGVDNNSQGFRDNFTNIAAALSATNADVVGLQITAMKQFQDNNASGYNLSNVNLVNSSVTIAPQGDGSTPVDYSQAAVWPITLLNSGINVVTVDNMPIGQRSGSLIVTVSSSSMYTQVLFTATTGTVVSLGPLDQPFNVDKEIPSVFELWNDYTGPTPYVYVKQLTESVVDAAFTNAIINSNNYYGNNATFHQSLNIGNLNYTTGTAYPSAGATVVTNGANYGTVALVPNIVSTVVSSAPVAIAGGASTRISVLNPAGIQVGASVYFSGTKFIESQVLIYV
jgi:surface antigen